jgi:hypothetical protein
MNPHLNNLNHMTAPVAVPSCSAHNRPDNGRCLSSNGNEKENHMIDLILLLSCFTIFFMGILEIPG